MRPVSHFTRRTDISEQSNIVGLEAVIAELGTRDQLVLRQKTVFDDIAGSASNIVIFGCGELGQIALAGALEAGLNVVAFADNNRSIWGRSIKGHPILSPTDAASKYGEDSVFVVAIFNGLRPRLQLHELGCKRIVPFPVFFWRFSEFCPNTGLELPERILESIEDIRRSFEVLSDRQSEDEFLAQIKWRCTVNYDCLPPSSPLKDIYYPPDLIRLSSDEVLVDCGAFDGDSIRMFLDRTSNSFQKIYAIEPDPQNCAALKSKLATVLTERRNDVSILPFAVSDRTETVNFNVTGTMGSRMTQSGDTIEIEARRLDELLAATNPTFIKMDVEGAEPKAIAGAINTIRHSRPLLAVCAYHKCEHLWTLPVILKAALPAYQIFLRRYAEECWETVYYAIPPERLATDRAR